MTTDDELLARLRAADPAGDRPTDLDALRRAVDRRLAHDAPSSVSGAVGEIGSTRPADPGSDDDGAPQPTREDELARRRERRDRRAPWVVGAAASLLLGVVGYGIGLGAGVGDGGTAGGAADEPAQEQAASSADGDSAGLTGDGSAGAEADGTAPTSGSDTMAAGGERAVLVADGLSTDAGSAEAYAYDAASVDLEAASAQAADVLGIVGEPVEQGGGWEVYDGEGRSVSVADDGQATLSLYDGQRDPTMCSDRGDCDDATLDEGRAVEIANEFVASLGVDVGDGGTVTIVSDGDDVVTVPVPVGDLGVAAATWTVSVGPEGVFGASGPLAPLTSLGDYDTVSAVDAVERLSDPRFGPTGVLYPADGPADEPEPSTGGGVAPGGPIPWPVATYTIDQAELTLTQFWLADGSVALLPTWELTSSDGSTWEVLAVADGALDFDAG